MKRLTAFLAAFTLLLGICACAAKQEEPIWQEQYDLGVRYLSEGNYEEAIIAFTAAIEIDPKQPDAYAELANVYLAMGEQERAAQVLSDGVTATGDEELQKVLDELSQPEPEPEPEPKPEPEPEPTPIVLTRQEQYDLGIRYLSDGNYQEAIIAFTAAIEIDPRQAPAYVGRGNAYVLLGETEENLSAAQLDYEKAIELDGTYAEAYLGLADVYIRQGNFEKALEILRQGLEKIGENQAISDKIAELESGNITDSSNNPRRMSVYGGDGNLLYWHDYTYNEQGLQSSVTSYNGSGEQTGYLQLTYTEDGEELDSYSWYSDTGEVLRVSHEYDDQSREIRAIWYFITGEPMQYIEYQYDVLGNLIRENGLNINGILKFYYLYEYDSQGHEAKRSQYEGDGALTSYSTYEYNESGDLIRYNTYRADGYLERYCLFSQDEQGNSITEEYDGDGNLIRSEVSG